LAENLTQCREYHREQLCDWSKVGRSLGLTRGGQNVSLLLCASGMRVIEKPFATQGPLSFSHLFNPGVELAYLTYTGQINWPTEFRPITKLFPMIFSTLCHQPNRTEADFPIGLVRCPL
jgi:hypothetical protein